jgi:hypothetical protein
MLKAYYIGDLSVRAEHCQDHYRTQGSPSPKPIEIHLLSMGFLFERLSSPVRLEEKV